MIRRQYRQKKNGKVVREKEEFIPQHGQSEPQPVAPVSPGVKQNPNIGLGSPIQINTGGGNPLGGKLPPPPPIERFPDPLIPKGLDDIKSPPPPPNPSFNDALQNQKELDIVTGEKKTIEQKLIQAQGLNLQNFVSFTVFYSNMAQGTETFIKKDYNQNQADITASGLQQHISFGDYYNILGIELNMYDLSANIAENGTNVFTFLPSQVTGLYDPTLSGDNNLYQPINNPFAFNTTTGSGQPAGEVAILSTFPSSIYQVITAHFNQPNKWGGFSENLSYTPRAYGLALESIRIHFQGSQNVNNALVQMSVYLAKDTAGQNL